jgi:predicted MFS family arabinose efflux permease
MSLLWRNWFAFVAVMATVLSVLGFLSVLQHDAILSRLIQERLTVIAETTASSFRSVVNLGLPISAMRNADQVLTRSREIDPAVTAIQVFNPTGIIVHSIGRDNSAPLSRELLLVQSLAKSNRWNAPTEDELRAGFSIKNRAGTTVGGVLVASSKREFAAKSETMAIRIAIASVLILAVSSVIAFLVLRLRLGGAIRGMEQLHRLSERFASDRIGTDHGVDAEPSRRNYGFLSSEIVKLEAQLTEAFRQFQNARSRFTELGAEVKGTGESGDDESDVGDTAIASVQETSFARVFARHLTPWTTVLVLGSALLLGSVIQQDVARSFEPELAARTKLIGTVANTNVQRAVSAGVPLQQLVGAERYFDDLLRNFPEISYFGVATGRIIYEAGARQKSVFAPERSRKDVPTFPIIANGEQIGYIIIDANPEFFALQFRDVLLDFGVVVLVVILLAFQIMVVVMSRSLTAPFMRLQHLAALQAAGDFSKVIAAKGIGAIDQLSRALSRHAFQLHRAFAGTSSQSAGDRDAAALAVLENRFSLRRWRPDFLQFSYLNDVRLPLFLFAAADELPLAFFPLFTRAADNPLTWLDPGVVISLPLAGYLVAIVFGSPIARPLAARFGHRQLLLFAIVPTLGAHLGLYFSTNVIEIVGYRTITGLGYAIATLTCQDYVLDVVPREHRNRSLGLFTAAMYSGVFAGTALGGVLADRLGQSPVFAVSAGLVLISGALTYHLMPARGTAEAAGPSAVTGAYLPPIWRPLGSLRFTALVFGIAIPANVLLQAFVSFLVALHLDALGASVADTGRILMTYFLAIAFVGPAASHLFDNRLRPAYVGLIGAVISGLSLCVVAVWPAQWSMLVAVAGAGIGHGMVRDPQVAVAMEIAERELAHLGSSAVLGSLRTLERGGSIVGLIAIALFASYAGYPIAVAVIAGLSLVGAAGFAVSILGGGVSSQSRQTAKPPPAETD